MQTGSELAGELRNHWEGLCRRLGLAGDVAGVWGQLRSHYGEAWRAYHNLGHVGDCLAACASCRELEFDRDAVEAALWFHDVIYVVGGKDSEARSAEFARECLASLGAWPAFVERVVGLILATDHRGAPPDIEGQIVCDIDLCILGRGIDVYDRYAAAIQAEVGLAEHVYVPHRQAFLRGMLTKERIFHTDYFGSRYEAAARVNMRRELQEWVSRMGQ